MLKNLLILSVQSSNMNQPITATAKHPHGLYVLFFTEMWERFGYYLMIGIFLLYLTDTVGHGGRGLDTVSRSKHCRNLRGTDLFNSFHRRISCRQVFRLYKINFFRRCFIGTWLFFNCIEWKRYNNVFRA